MTNPDLTLGTWHIKMQETLPSALQGSQSKVGVVVVGGSLLWGSEKAARLPSVSVFSSI